jgi:glycosyltransferase involved in cell wall biosynthesis
MTDDVAAVIPAFRAAPWVGAVVRGTLEQLDSVVVVDDGSDDATAAEARNAGARVLSHPRNLGKASALRTAFADLLQRGVAAVVTLDADGQHLPSEIPKLLEAHRDGADLVLGSRDHLFAGMSGLRRWSNRLSSAAISFAAGAPVADVQTGFRLYTLEMLARTGFAGHRFAAESAVVVRALRLGFRVVAVPIELGFADGRSTSHYRPLVDSLRIARAVIAARLRPRGSLTSRP